MTTEAVEKVSSPVTAEDDVAVAGGEHGEIAVILIRYLAAHVYDNKLGRVFDGQTNFELSQFGKERQPDIAFVSLARLPRRVVGTVPMPPDLAIEIVSPTDKSYDVDEKVNEYLQANVRLVWVVRPLRRVVEVYAPANPYPRLLTPDDELDGQAIVPGFKLKVATLFE